MIWHIYSFEMWKLINAIENKFCIPLLHFRFSLETPQHTISLIILCQFTFM